MLSLFLWLLVLGPAKTDMTNEPSALLTRLGSDVHTMVVDGSLSASNQPIQGLTFHAEMDSTGAYLLTMGGPFGITAAKMYAAADTFVMVNYLMQEVWFGNPNSPYLRAASHLPLPASHLMALLRGRVPGTPSRFSPVPREGTNALFSCADSAGVEYILVDTTQNTMVQYQRKDTAGVIDLDVAFQDFRMVEGIPIAFKLIIRSVKSNQQAMVTIRTADLNTHLDKPLALSVPETFERRKFD